MEKGSWRLRREEDGFIIATYRMEESIAMQDGEVVSDPYGRQGEGEEYQLALEATGRVVEFRPPWGDDRPCPEGLECHLRRLWRNAYPSLPVKSLSGGYSWGMGWDAELPQVGWVPLPTVARVEGFQRCGEVGCARVALSAYAGPQASEVHPADREELEDLTSRALFPGPPGADLRGEGAIYINPEGGWVSSSEMLLVGSEILQGDEGGLQLQYSVQEKQNNW